MQPFPLMHCKISTLTSMERNSEQAQTSPASQSQASLPAAWQSCPITLALATANRDLSSPKSVPSQAVSAHLTCSNLVLKCAQVQDKSLQGKHLSTSLQPGYGALDFAHQKS